MTHTSSSPQINYLNHKTGLWSWLTTTDHKRIGLLYLYSITIFFLIAAMLGLLMRIEKIAPGETIMTAQTYNAMFTIHGIIMIFAIVIPGLSAVFGNFFLPIMIGARDVAFPRLNLFAWYLYITGAGSGNLFTICLWPFTRRRMDLLCALQRNIPFQYGIGAFCSVCSWICIHTYRIKLYRHYTSDCELRE